MTGGALTRRVVLALRRVAREAEAAIGDEPRDRRLSMAGVAGYMRIRGIGMRGAKLDSAVTGAAVPAGVVMILVTSRACLHGCRGIERDRRLVTRGAADVRMGRVRERDGPRARGTLGHCDGDGFGVSRSQLTRRMAGRAIVRRRRLMVADLATTWRLEREPGGGPAGHVTGKTGELLVTVVREGINGGWELGVGNGGGPRWVRISLALGFPIQIANPRNASQRACRIERLRRIHSPVAAGLHSRMASRAVAGVHLGRMGLVA